MLGPTLQALTEQTESSLDRISILFTVKSLGFLVGSFFVGRIYDRVKGHPIFLVALLGMTATLFLIPLVNQLTTLSIIIFFLGLCLGSLDVGGNTLLVWVHRKKVGPYMNGLHFIWGAGAVLTPLILVGLTYIVSSDSSMALDVRALDVRWTYWIIGLFMIPVALWVIRLPSPAAAQPEEVAEEDSSHVVLLILLGLFYFLYIGAEVSITGWIVTYVTQTGLVSLTTAAYLNSAFFAALTITRLIMIPVAARYRPSPILIANLLICIISAALMVAMPLSWPAILTGIIGLGIGMSTIFPMMLAFAQNRMAVTGKTTSWIFLGASAGGMSVPWVVGQLFERISPQVVLIAILACVVGTAIVFGVIKAGWERTAR